MIDMITLRGRLDQIGELDNIGGINYITVLMNATPGATNAESYSKIVHNCSVKRKLLRCTHDIQKLVRDQGDSTSEEIVSLAQNKIFELGRERERGSGLSDIKGTAVEAIKNIQQIYESEEKHNITGIASGFTDLDKITAGFQKTDVIVIAARPGMGKTALAMNIAEHVAIQLKLKVAVFTLEMSALQLTLRSLASLSSISSVAIRTGNLGEGDQGVQNWRNLTHAAELLYEAPIYIDDTSALSPLDIANRARRMAHEVGLDLIVIDYLQLLSSATKADNRNAELSSIMRELKFLAKELNVPVIALSQLKRDVETRPGKRPQLIDLRDSGAIEQDADLVLFIFREDYYDKETTNYGMAEINIAKHRNGEVPHRNIKLTFIGEYCLFQNHIDSAAVESF